LARADRFLYEISKWVLLTYSLHEWVCVCLL
jgi:hypothetical protein